MKNNHFKFVTRKDLSQKMLYVFVDHPSDTASVSVVEVVAVEYFEVSYDCRAEV